MPNLRKAGDVGCHTNNSPMQKATALFLAFVSLASAFGQTSKKVVGYLSTQYNKTIYDRTLGNNPWSIGLGLQSFFNNNLKLKATVDLTADAYLEDDKVLRTNSDSTPISDVGGMINFFMGVSYHPIKVIYLSVVAGPSLVSGKVLLGLKPSLGFYFSQNQKWGGILYFINVFNRDKKTNEDFGSIGLSVYTRLF